MVSDPAKNKTDGVQKHDGTECEHTRVTLCTKTRVHYCLKLTASFIGVILVSSLLMPLLFPILLSSGVPIVLTAKSSSSQVELKEPFAKTNVLTPNSLFATRLQEEVQTRNTTTLTVFAPETTLQGSNFILSGALSRTCPPQVLLSQKTVDLYDSATNHVIGSTRTDLQGNYSFAWSESSWGTYTYYVRFPGDLQNRPRTSENVVVNVLPLNARNTTLAIFAVQTVPQRNTFTLSGYLEQTYSGHSVCNQIIHLYGNATNHEIGSAQTDSQGYYSFAWKENSSGTYDYYARFESDSQIMQYRSENVTVKVSDQLEPTYLTIYPPLYLVDQGDNFMLSGSLLLSCGMGSLNNCTIHIYRNNLTLGNNQEIGSVKTDEQGLYTLTWQENLPGTYDYYAHFEGDSQISPYRSENVTVYVSS